MSTRIQVTVPDPTLDRWRRAAELAEMPLSSWVQLQVERPDMPGAVERMTQAASDITAATSATLDVLRQMSARMAAWDAEEGDA